MSSIRLYLLGDGGGVCLRWRLSSVSNLCELRREMENGGCEPTCGEVVGENVKMVEHCDDSTTLEGLISSLCSSLTKKRKWINGRHVIVMTQQHFEGCISSLCSSLAQKRKWANGRHVIVMTQQHFEIVLSFFVFSLVNSGT
ncbi:hypothetical protein Tco_0522581 [Tanacetum coccineum]